MIRQQIHLFNEALIISDDFGFCAAVDFLTDEVKHNNISSDDCRVVLAELIKGEKL